jgi:chromosomal replication initiator protein
MYNDSDKIVIGVVSNFMKDNIAAKFTKQILEAIQKEISTVTIVEFQVDKQIDSPSNPNVIDCTRFYKEKDIKKGVKLTNTPETMSEIKIRNERYTLANFVVWGDNQLAFSACEAVVRNPWKSYNPLYIYGDVGLGKTHLLQGTGYEIKKKFKDKNVVYTTADKFITDYVGSVKKRSVEKMRQRYSEADVIIIDDVQFLAKKEQTQNELYNIFNLLYDANKQIIISGDRPPKELTELEPRLRSRFEWWITVDIGKPDYETRLAIVQEKAREKEFLLSQEIAEFIAANVTENVREIEWVLNQIIAEYEISGMMPTLTKVAEKLKKLSFTTDILGNSKTTKTTIRSYEDVIDAVSKRFGIEKEGILWENRRKEFMIPRQVAMYLLKTKMNYTYERIGNIFSGRNHAAVLYSCNKLEKIIQKDRNLLNEVNLIREGMGI